MTEAGIGGSCQRYCQCRGGSGRLSTQAGCSESSQSNHGLGADDPRPAGQGQADSSLRPLARAAALSEAPSQSTDWRRAAGPDETDADRCRSS